MKSVPKAVDILWENKSITVAKYHHPSFVYTYVISDAQTLSGCDNLNCWFNQ